MKLRRKQHIRYTTRNVVLNVFAVDPKPIYEALCRLA